MSKRLRGVGTRNSRRSLRPRTDKARPSSPSLNPAPAGDSLPPEDEREDDEIVAESTADETAAREIEAEARRQEEARLAAEAAKRAEAEAARLVAEEQARKDEEAQRLRLDEAKRAAEE